MAEVITIERERLPYHPLLGRNVKLDSRSRAYALQPSAEPIMSVRHVAYIGILDQGQVGACTGFASTACAYREPFYAPTAPAWRYAPAADGAFAWYHQNTAEDDYAGTWEPDDTGSDGLTSSKVAKEAGITSGYQAALDLDSSLLALMDRPGVTGLPWYNSMFNADSGGLLTVDTSSGLAGGHELCVDEVVAPDAVGNGTGELLVGGPNSWGDGWGAGGRWYLRASDWWKLRQQQGDVYFWAAKSQPTPTPAPVTPTPSIFDVALWEKTAEFRADHHVMPHIVQAAKALETWGGQWGFHG